MGDAEMEMSMWGGTGWRAAFDTHKYIKFKKRTFEKKVCISWIPCSEATISKIADSSNKWALLGIRKQNVARDPVRSCVYLDNLFSARNIEWKFSQISYNPKPHVYTAGKLLFAISARHGTNGTEILCFLSLVGQETWSPVCFKSLHWLRLLESPGT